MRERNTYAKRQRETQKKRKAEEKRERRRSRRKVDDVAENPADGHAPREEQ